MAKLWEQYLAEGGGATAADFGVWLIRHGDQAPAATELSSPSIPAASPTASPFNLLGHQTMAAILIGRLQKFLHLASKGIMRQAGLSADEFVVLATLLYAPRMAKTQLLKQCLIEFPTGTELLKRMKLAGLILEKKNPDDGRSAFITIAAKGRQQLMKCFEQLAQVEDALACLDDTDKSTLVTILGKLDRYHSDRHQIKQVKALMEAGSQLAPPAFKTE